MKNFPKSVLVCVMLSAAVANAGPGVIAPPPIVVPQPMPAPQPPIDVFGRWTGTIDDHGLKPIDEVILVPAPPPPPLAGGALPDLTPWTAWDETCHRLGVEYCEVLASCIEGRTPAQIAATLRKRHWVLWRWKNGRRVVIAPTATSVKVALSTRIPRLLQNHGDGDVARYAVMSRRLARTWCH